MTESSSALTRRHDALAVRDDVAASTARVAFDDEACSWSDLPGRTRQLARRTDPVLAERAVRDAVVYETPLGLVQVLRAWRAHPGAVLLAVAQRTVRIVDDRVRPTSPWAHASLRSYDAVATPRRRIGVVPSAVGDRSGVHPWATSTTGSAPAAVAAQEAWAYLPSAVRRTVEKVVPVPQDWIGDLQQTNRAGAPTSQDIVVLSRSAASAVVVVARRSAPELSGATLEEVTRRLAHEPWTVEQLTYDLHEPLLLGPAMPRPEHPWT